MKQISQNLRLLFLAIPVIVILVFSIYMLAQLALESALYTDENDWLNYQQRDFHVVVLFPDSEDSLYRRIREGLSSFLDGPPGADMGLQFLEPFPFMTSRESMFRHSEIAQIAAVDGVIIAAPVSSTLQEALRAARARGVKVVSMNGNLSDSAADSVVAVNSFALGAELGQSILNLPIDLQGVALLSSNRALISDFGEFQNGLKTAVFAGDRRLPISVIELSPDDIFARQAIEKILNESPGYNLIITDSPDITMNLSQAIIEQNIVGSAYVIGSGSAEELEDYIDAGIIQGLMNISPGEAALKTLSVMSELLNGREPRTDEEINVRLEGM